MSRLAPAVAISLFYGAWFATLGVYLPYFNLYLDRLDLDSAQIGIVNAILPLCGAVVPALLGHLSDRHGRRRSLVVASSMLALLAFLPMFRVAGFTGAAAVMAVHAAARAPALPLVEANALEMVERGGPAYGRMRVWGSFAFIITSLAAGPLVGRLGEDVVPILIAMLLMAGVAAALQLPPDPAPPQERRTGGGVRQALRRRSVALFLLGGVLMQASHGPYYVFFSLHLRQAGIPPRTLGLLWAAAIGAEILMMLRMPSILMRHGPVTIMAACSALAAVRWTLCALSVEPLLLLPAQVLHAATFAAFHIAAVSHAFSEFGRERSATGQAIFSSATYGLGSILGMVGSGLLRDPLGTPALFGCAAGVALAGGLLLASVARPRRGALP